MFKFIPLGWAGCLEYVIVPGEDLDHVPGREGNVQEETNLADQVLLLGNLQPEVSDPGIASGTTFF